MPLVEINAIATSNLPLAELGAFMQLQASPTGVSRQDQFMEVALRGAIMDLEARTGRFMLRRAFRYQTAFSRKVLVPVGPNDLPELMAVSHDHAPISISQFETTSVGSAFYICEKVALPSGDYEFTIEAGKPTWGELEPDLQTAILNLAAHFYQSRFSGERLKFGVPQIVSGLIEKYRKIKILRG